MRKGRELFVLFFCILAELGLFFQVYRPIHFVETFIIEKGMVSWTIPRIICMIPMIAIGIFAMAVIKGNANGMLHISYAVMTLYLMIMLGMMFAQRGVFIETFEIVEMNIIVYIVGAVLGILTLLLFIFREKGAIRFIPNMSSLLLLVILAQFISHFFALADGKAYMSRLSFVCSVCAAMPYVAIYLFEKIMVEPTIKQYR